MSGDGIDEFGSLPPADQRLVNECCGRFEAALAARPTAVVEEFLAAVGEPTLSVLLRELLVLEISAALRRGEAPTVEPLLARFPGRPSLVEEVLRLAASYPVVTPEGLRLADGTPATVGRFRLIEELGRGGFGVVFLAEDTTDGTNVALKVPHAAVLFDRGMCERFACEAAAARLDHPNIVRVRDSGTDGFVSYLATEYVPGPTLAAWLKARQVAGVTTPAVLAVAVLLPIADAVGHAHARGVWHCDLTPANVLLGDGPEPLPRVTDFGLARIADESRTASASGLVVGTPAYMAPEQAAGRRSAVSERTDVYALGAILYELLTGRPPAGSDSLAATLDRAIRGRFPRPRAVRRDIPRALEAVCLKCLEPKPERRYPTAADMAADLRRFQAGTPTTARPPGPARRVRLWWRENPTRAGKRLALTAAGFVLTGVGLGLVAYTLLLMESNRKLDVANDLLRAERDLARRQGDDLRRLAYADAMQKTAVAVDRNEVTIARRLLDAWRPDAGAEDLRGFEWYYMQHLLMPGRFQSSAPGPDVYGLAVTRDAATVLTAADDGRVRLLDVKSFAVQAEFAHPADVNQVVALPDGVRFASVADDGKLRVWHRERGLLAEVPVGSKPDRGLLPKGSVGSKPEWSRAIALAPDGRTLAAGARDGTIVLLNADAPNAPPRTLGRIHDSVYALAFGRTGEDLIVGTLEGEVPLHQAVRIFRVADGSDRAVPGQGKSVHAIAVAADGRVAVGSSRGTVLLWEPTAGGWTPAGRIDGAFGRINDLAYSPDGELLLVTGAQAVELWGTRPLRKRAVLRGHDGRVWAGRFDPTGQTVFTAGATGRVHRWAVEELTRAELLVAATHNVRWIAFPTDPRSPLKIVFPPVGNDTPGWFASAADTPTGQVTVEGDNIIRWWQGPSLLDVRRVPLEDAPRDWSPRGLLQNNAVTDGRYVAIKSGDPYAVGVWDAATGRRVFQLSGPDATVTAVALGPSGQLAIGSAKGRIGVYDILTGNRLASFEGHSGNVWSMAFDPTGRSLASGGADPLARVWDVATGVERHRLAADRRNVYRVAFAPDGRTLATGGEDGTLRLWHAATGVEMVADPGPDTGIVHLQFDLDGRRLAAVRISADWKCRVKVYGGPSD